jgi:hypothetical protein
MLPCIRIIGIGGAGCRVIDTISRTALQCAECLLVDADLQQLAQSTCHKRNLIGDRFGCEWVTFVGDRGMIKIPQIKNLPEGFHYITAITKPQINSLTRYIQTSYLPYVHQPSSGRWPIRSFKRLPIPPPWSSYQYIYPQNIANCKVIGPSLSLII